MHRRRPSPSSLLLLPSRLKAVMDVAVMAIALAVANQAKAVLRDVVMDVALVAKAAERAVDAAGVVDARAMEGIARAAHNANASTPKVNPCSQTPICRAPALEHKNPRGKSNALTVAHAQSAGIGQTVVANAMKAANAASHAQKAALRASL